MKSSSIIRRAMLSALLLLGLSLPASCSKGFSIPDIGLGLWNSKGEKATNAVEYAFKAGYHHFDSAAAYGNEDYVGAALSKHPRASYFLTSKLWNTAHRPALVEKALNATLSNLNTTHLDLYLVHWPVAFVPDSSSGRTIIDQDTTLLSTWGAMESLVPRNLTRHIGVSNFSPRQLDLILKSCTICPVAHEFESHPYLQQSDFVAWHQKHNITVIAYSPLANLNPTYNGTHAEVPSILEDPFWLDLAAKKNATVPQAVLAWARQRGTVVIPKSTHEQRIVENWASKNVTFGEKEMALVAEQDLRTRFNDPSKIWGVELFEDLDDGSSRFMLEQQEL